MDLFLLHFYFYDNILLCAVSCLLRFPPELSNDNKKQAQQVMRCYTMIVSTVLTDTDLIAIIPARRHASV